MTKRAESARRSYALARRFWPHAHAARAAIAASLVLIVIAPLLATALLWMLQKLIDEVLVARNLDLVPWLLAGYFVVATAKFGVEYADLRLDAWVVERIVQDLRVASFSHLITVSPGTHGGRSVGDLLAYLGDDLERIAALVYGVPVGLFAHFAKALCFAGFLILLSWKLTLVSLLVVPPLALYVSRLSPKVRQAARIARRRASAWMALAEEKLGATSIIHSYDAQDFEAARFARRCDGARDAEVVAASLEARLNLGIDVIAALGALLVIAVATLEVHAGALSVGGVMAFLAAVGSLYDPIRGLSQGASRLQRAAASAERVAALVDKPSQVRESAGARTVPPSRGRVRFERVSFAYPNAGAALRELSLDIEPGELVAVVGPSGSGKSTLVRLLLRLYDPDRGRILLDGSDIRILTLRSLRSTLAVVLQEPHLFLGSVADNIRYNRTQTSLERVRAAATAACADDFIRRLAAGYAAPVGPHGNRLSGGQRQRLALARALVGDAQILVLDEATAAIDSETEELIQNAIARLAGQRTVIAISHRLSTMRRADRVIMLEHGRIVETGTPSELLRHGTRCRELFAAQLARQDTSTPSSLWLAAN